MKPSFEILTGRTDGHVALHADGKSRLHRDALADFARLAAEAQKDGFELKVVSSFRDFAAQLRIWNEKTEGKRPLLDRMGAPLDPAKLSPDEIVTAILRWSALPGASRHHWGTDFDVVAGNVLPDGYQVQLTPQEITKGQVFEAFGAWLEDRLPFAGFYRPYAEERGGVSPEWWHLSYAPIAETYRRAYKLSTLRRSVEASDLRLKPIVEARLEEIFETYVDNVADPAPES
jgi:LAS superfamily LD-carboxypeptidase LdcB